jgi:hypothetical protein
VNDPRWLVLTWRLGSGSSTPRVTTWRSLKRMGAVLLTPGAAAVPYTEDLLEQFEWLAQRIGESGGEAWVLPVAELTEPEEARIRARMRHAREQEYADLRSAADTVATSEPSRRQTLALEHGYRAIVGRDHFGASGRGRARKAIDRAAARRS